MEKEKLDFFRQLLNTKLDELITEAGKTVSEMSDAMEDSFPDPTDRASHETDRNFLLRVKDRERRLIVKIQDALKRIANNTYGICETCGEEITEKRLIARPVTTSCIKCKEEEELEEKKRRSQ